MIDPILGYSRETEELIRRQCRNVERKDFELDQDNAAECILKTYDLFNLPRSKHVVWVTDIFDKQFDTAAGSAGSAWLAGSAWSAGSAWLAWLAGSAGSAWSARSARSARSAWSAGSARSARSAGSAWLAGSAWSAWLAGSAWSALDYDFDYYTFEYEYCHNPDAAYPPNENDRKYLDYCDLLMQAKEYGAGYRVEWEDTLYIAPTPLVRIDAQNRFHSETEPAIRWKGGAKFYYLKGENFDKELWERIVSKAITADEVMRISDTDKRAIAISMLKPEEMLKQLKAKLIDTGSEGTQLYECKNFMGTRKTEYCMFMKDWSTDRTFIEFVPPEIGKKHNAVYAQASAYGIPGEDYLLIKERG